MTQQNVQSYRCTGWHFSVWHPPETLQVNPALLISSCSFSPSLSFSFVNKSDTMVNGNAEPEDNGNHLNHQLHKVILVCFGV